MIFQMLLQLETLVTALVIALKFSDIHLNMKVMNEGYMASQMCFKVARLFKKSQTALKRAMKFSLKKPLHYYVGKGQTEYNYHFLYYKSL